MQTTKPVIVGIDPGTKTGLSVLNKETGNLNLHTFKLHEAWDFIRSIKDSIRMVVIENPNLWTHFHNTKNAKEKLQGAGSIKRDYSAWRDFLEGEEIEYRSVRPDKTRNALAVDMNKFKQITGYSRRCSEHARVAGLLVYGL